MGYCATIRNDSLFDISTACNLSIIPLNILKLSRKEMGMGTQLLRFMLADTH
jgi:hypothetical protein